MQKAKVPELFYTVRFKVTNGTGTGELITSMPGIAPATLKGLCPENEAGFHYMMIYDEIDLLRQVYCEISKGILNNNGVVLILTYFENPSTVEFYLKNTGIDVDQNRRAESLFIIDSVQQFFNSSAEDVVRFVELLNKKAIRQGKNGVTAIIDMDVLFHFNQKEEFEKFESIIGQTGNESKFRCMLCAYHKSRFDRLEERTQISLKSRHKSCINEDGTIFSQSI